MRNERGFVTVGVVVVILIVSMVIIGTFFNPILSTSVDMKDSREIIPKYVNDSNGLERTYSTIKDNISYNGEIVFDDIEKEYEVSEVDSEYSTVELSLSELSNSFEIENKTDIEILLEMAPEDNVNPSSYNVELILNGSESVISQSGLDSNTVLNVPANFVYNESTGEKKYGNYSLSVEAENSTVTAKVKYKKLDYRKVTLKNDSIDKILIIDNRQEDSKVYFEE